jgi:hypothetical protein
VFLSVVKSSIIALATETELNVCLSVGHARSIRQVCICLNKKDIRYNAHYLARSKIK